MQKHLDNLLKKLKNINPSSNLESVVKAFNFAEEKHRGQMRVSGEPYFTHPIAVANILADMELDTSSVTAALLHDVVEDTDVTDADIEREFGATIALLVSGVTKLGKIPYTSKEDQQVENLRKMFLAMANDVRVIVIKLADRLHNMRTLKSMPEHKQREKARETLEVFAPLAHRLGMSKIKMELEDLSLKYIDPIAYYEIVDKISQKQSEREEYINDIIEMFDDRLKRLSIEAHVEGRAKHFYSIYRKMFMQNKSIEEIYDLFAVRVIVNTDADCYAVLGMVHELFMPIPGRFKDYIAMPKPNMYQSLHSTVIGPNGAPFEVQIRTWEMHRTAENGIAAHWKYKEGLSGKSDIDGKLEWIKQLLEIQKDMTNAEDFMQTLKIDMFSDEVFVFTPKGDVISLPAGATPIDFAYAIHSAVGNKMQGAKVNGKIVTLDYILHNGDIIEIHTSNASRGPNLDWLKIAKTSQARNKINQWLKKENRTENIAKGKEILERELKKAGIPSSYANNEEMLETLLGKYGFKQLDDMYATLGYGGSSANKYLAKFKENCKKDMASKNNLSNMPEQFIVKTSGKPNHSGVIVEGIDNCLVRISHCCSPVPGDKIIGYVTRGRGVAVHRTDCINITNAKFSPEEEQRFINVCWASAVESDFQALLCITAIDRNSLLVDITGVTADLRTPIKSLNARTAKNNVAIVEISIEIKNTEHLDNAIKKLKQIDGVQSVVRRRQ
ncbi:MAG: bifunctional (p)ppGpp synthetase/guanosine-3',5'-bis(diphosphate) 3'-pyrophosphohydrolase [Clostridia bacterium]|nr:bifunctional (p)ppGpp synthetase/guanosine-3',5'-bis(diphosphate) 3'-pyrophosphohydrolase [Oscillospiraceae bacterium]MBQ7960607.1 bifunctional (p)ppGpp synthetase/guanosine-3',5'-bis(diphosphate) 3'-pyrophosphohydrolase [Clostridia bacterium]